MVNYFSKYISYGGFNFVPFINIGPDVVLLLPDKAALTVPHAALSYHYKNFHPGYILWSIIMLLNN